MHVFGASASASDFRLLAYFLLNCLGLSIAVILNYSDKTIAQPLFTVLFTFILANNPLLNFLNISPKQIMNEKEKQNKFYQDLFFFSLP